MSLAVHDECRDIRTSSWILHFLHYGSIPALGNWAGLVPANLLGDVGYLPYTCAHVMEYVLMICFNLTLNHLILSYLILSYLILSYLILSYLILSYLILSYLILSYLIKIISKLHILKEMVLWAWQRLVFLRYL